MFCTAMYFTPYFISLACISSISSMSFSMRSANLNVYGLFLRRSRRSAVIFAQEPSYSSSLRQISIKYRRVLSGDMSFSAVSATVSIVVSELLGSVCIAIFTH